MKHILSLLLTCVFAIGYGQDFSVSFSTGKTLYFDITSANTVKIAKGKSVISYDDFWGKNVYGYSFSGSLNIPATVTDRGNTYYVTEIGNLENTNLSTIIMPNSVTIIDYNAFYNCKELITITLSNSLEIIGSGAFGWCSKLSSIILPESLHKIDYRAFEKSGLTSIIIPGNVNSIGFEAFKNCYSLTFVEIKEGVKILDHNNYGCGTFDKCYRLKTVKLPQSLLPYFYRDGYAHVINAFYDCHSLEKIIVPTGTIEEFMRIIPEQLKHLLVEE